MAMPVLTADISTAQARAALQSEKIAGHPADGSFYIFGLLTDTAGAPRGLLPDRACWSCAALLFF